MTEKETYLEQLEAIEKRVANDGFRFCVAQQLLLDECVETDFSTLTAQEIIETIREHLNQKPSDANSLIFFHLLAYYPVTMCKREISPRLKKLIGFYYNLGVPSEHEANEHGVEKVSFRDLVEIFNRSKATFSACVNEFKPEWAVFQRDIKEAQAIEAEARKQLVEEEKERLAENVNGKQTSEQTSEIYTGEGIHEENR